MLNTYIGTGHFNYLAHKIGVVDYEFFKDRCPRQTSIVKRLKWKIHLRAFVTRTR